MEFTRESLAQEVDKQFGALTLTDAPGGPVELRSYLRLDPVAIAQMNRIDEQIATLDDPKRELDDEAQWTELRRLTIDRLALMADRPDALREYVVNDDLATLRVLTKAWREATQGESVPQ